MLTLKDLQAADAVRNKEFDPEGKLDLAFRGTELAGEAGEACNVIKKLVRERLGIKGSRATLEDLADELGDVIICVSLIANHEGIDLEDAVRNKFNKTSDALGMKTRL